MENNNTIDWLDLIYDNNNDTDDDTDDDITFVDKITNSKSENVDLKVIDVTSSNVSYNQLNIMNKLSNELYEIQIKYNNELMSLFNKFNKETITKLNSNEILFLLYLDKKVIGFGLVTIDKMNLIEKGAVLKKIYISSNYQHLGYGSIFLNKIEKNIKEKYNIDLIFLDCLYTNTANEFYTKQDYTPVSIMYVKKIK